MTTEPFPRPARRLWLWLSIVWSTVWILGVGLFAIAAILIASRYFQQQLDSRIRVLATAIYGLAYFDENGQFQGDLLQYEDDLFEPGDGVWIIQPGPRATIHLGNQNRRFEADVLESIASQVVDGNEKIFADLTDANGRPLRLLAVPTYPGTSDQPMAAIIVAADPRATTRANWTFGMTAVIAALVLGLLGKGVGAMLASWSLRPLARFLAQRDQFLGAAAHLNCGLRWHHCKPFASPLWPAMNRLKRQLSDWGRWFAAPFPMWRDCYCTLVWMRAASCSTPADFDWTCWWRAAFRKIVRSLCRRKK